MKTLLLALLLLLAAPTHAQTDRQLLNRFDRAEAQGNFEQALAAATAIAQRYPESSNWAFNAGRIYSKLNRPEQAIAQLQRAADLGYTGVASFEQHEHLDPLRDRDDFKAILDQVRANAAERMDEFQAEARKHQPPTLVPDDHPESPALVIALHGTGGKGEQMLRALERSCEHLGIVCIAPDALRPAGDGYAWTYRDESEWFVDHLISTAAEEHGIDPKRVIVVGFSQGANIALILAQSRQDLIAAAVPVCGHYEPSNTNADTAPVPTYLLTGSKDDWKSTNVRAEKDFQGAGGEAELRIVTGMGHQMANDREVLRALEWCLKQMEPKSDG